MYTKLGVIGPALGLLTVVACAAPVPLATVGALGAMVIALMFLVQPGGPANQLVPGSQPILRVAGGGRSDASHVLHPAAVTAPQRARDLCDRSPHSCHVESALLLVRVRRWRGAPEQSRLLRGLAWRVS